MASGRQPDGRECAFCRHGKEVSALCGPLRYQPLDSQGEELAAHQRCMQYSSDLVQDTFEHFGGFLIEEVEKEIKRGKQLKCSDCKNCSKKKKRLVRVTTGATAGCEVPTCRQSFHYYCARVQKRTSRRRRKMGRKEVDAFRTFCSLLHKQIYVDGLRSKGIEESSCDETEYEDDENQLSNGNDLEGDLEQNGNHHDSDDARRKDRRSAKPKQTLGKEKLKSRRRRTDEEDESSSASTRSSGKNKKQMKNGHRRSSMRKSCLKSSGGRGNRERSGDRKDATSESDSESLSSSSSSRSVPRKKPRTRGNAYKHSDPQPSTSTGTPNRKGEKQRGSDSESLSSSNSRSFSSKKPKTRGHAHKHSDDPQPSTSTSTPNRKEQKRKSTILDETHNLYDSGENSNSLGGIAERVKIRASKVSPAGNNDDPQPSTSTGIPNRKGKKRRGSSSDDIYVSEHISSSSCGITERNKKRASKVPPLGLDDDDDDFQTSPPFSQRTVASGIAKGVKPRSSNASPCFISDDDDDDFQTSPPFSQRTVASGIAKVIESRSSNVSPCLLSDDDADDDDFEKSPPFSQRAQQKSTSKVKLDNTKRDALLQKQQNDDADHLDSTEKILASPKTQTTRDKVSRNGRSSSTSSNATSTQEFSPTTEGAIATDNGFDKDDNDESDDELPEFNISASQLPATSSTSKGSDQLKKISKQQGQNGQRQTTDVHSNEANYSESADRRNNNKKQTQKKGQVKCSDSDDSDAPRRKKHPIRMEKAKRNGKRERDGAAQKKTPPKRKKLEEDSDSGSDSPFTPLQRTPKNVRKESSGKRSPTRTKNQDSDSDCDLPSVSKRPRKNKFRRIESDLEVDSDDAACNTASVENARLVSEGNVTDVAENCITTMQNETGVATNDEECDETLRPDEITLAEDHATEGNGAVEENHVTATKNETGITTNVKELDETRRPEEIILAEEHVTVAENGVTTMQSETGVATNDEECDETRRPEETTLADENVNVAENGVTTMQNETGIATNEEEHDETLRPQGRILAEDNVTDAAERGVTSMQNEAHIEERSVTPMQNGAIGEENHGTVRPDLLVSEANKTGSSQQPEQAGPLSKWEQAVMERIKKRGSFMQSFPPPCIKSLLEDDFLNEIKEEVFETQPLDSSFIADERPPEPLQDRTECIVVIPADPESFEEVASQVRQKLVNDHCLAEKHIHFWNAFTPVPLPKMCMLYYIADVAKVLDTNAENIKQKEGCDDLKKILLDGATIKQKLMEVYTVEAKELKDLPDADSKQQLVQTKTQEMVQHFEHVTEVVKYPLGLFTSFTADNGKPTNYAVLFINNLCDPDQSLRAALHKEVSMCQWLGRGSDSESLEFTDFQDVDSRQLKAYRLQELFLLQDWISVTFRGLHKIISLPEEDILKLGNDNQDFENLKSRLERKVVADSQCEPEVPIVVCIQNTNPAVVRFKGYLELCVKKYSQKFRECLFIFAADNLSPRQCPHMDLSWLNGNINIFSMFDPACKPIYLVAVHVKNRPASFLF